MRARSFWLAGVAGCICFVVVLVAAMVGGPHLRLWLLESRFNSGDIHEKTGAVLAFGRLGTPESIARLVTVAWDDRSPEIRYVALFALVSLADDRIVDSARVELQRGAPEEEVAARYSLPFLRAIEDLSGLLERKGPGAASRVEDLPEVVRFFRDEVYRKIK